MIRPPHVWMRDGIMGSFCGRSWAPGISKANVFDAQGDAWEGYVLNCISKCLKNCGIGIVNKLQMPEPAALPELFRTFAEKTGRKQLVHDKYTIPAVVACHGKMAQANFLQKCDMCQGITSHERWHPIEVMRLCCKQCHNFWVMKITWELS